MSRIFTKCIWQPCTCQPNELKGEIKKKTGEVKQGAKQKSGGAMAHSGPPLRIATASGHNEDKKVGSCSARAKQGGCRVRQQ